MSPKNQNISQGNPKKLPPPSKCGRQWRQPVGLVIICVRQCVNVLLPSFILSMYCLPLVSFILYFVNVLLVSCARVNILWGWRILLDIALSSCQISRSRSDSCQRPPPKLTVLSLTLTSVQKSTMLPDFCHLRASMECNARFDPVLDHFHSVIGDPMQMQPSIGKVGFNLSSS